MRLRYFVALVVALDRSGNKLKPNKTKEFLGGNRRNEIRYRYYLPDFMHVRISR